MISAVIVTRNDQADLVAVLAPLVPASMDGLVRELIVADQGSTDATLEIAEEAGAVLVSGGRDEAIARARGDWILLLTRRSRLTPAWVAAAKDHISKHPGRSGAFALPGWFDKRGALLVPKDKAVRGLVGRVRLIRI